MIQTHWVARQLQQHWPELAISIEQIRTTGDRVTNQPLAQIGGDGVFVTEIENALHEHRVDLAVHSLKDLPTTQPSNLRVVVTGPREDVRDVLIIRKDILIVEEGDKASLDEISITARLQSQPFRLGTCSLRRTAQLRALYPQAQILALRGNVDTRLRKLDEGQYDAIILAAAGLHRMDVQERLAGRVVYLPIETVLPAPGQGALALECRDEPGMLELLAPLRDALVEASVSAERLFMRRLGAGCYLPVAAYGNITADTLSLNSLVASLDGQRRIRVSQQIPWTSVSTVEHAEALGVSVAEEALRQGAQEIIREIAPLREQESLNV
jgi:hydroxymethylbilane synthase